MTERHQPLRQVKMQQTQYKTYEHFPYDDLLTYAGLDCIVTPDILQALDPELGKRPAHTVRKGGLRHGKDSIIRLESIQQSMDRCTMPAFEFICDMEINGVKYDVAKNAEIASRMTREVAELEGRIAAITGLSSSDLDSGKILAHYLYEVRQFPVLSYTKTGEPSTDGDALKELSKQVEAPWLLDIMKRNDIASVYRTFIRDYVRDHVKSDGRLHPSYNLNGTSSFRITGDKPNLTQLPRPKHGYNVRECFTVDEGNVFIAFDFSSAEVKVLGALCRDPGLLKAIREGKDFHSYSASAMHGVSYEEFVEVLANESHPLYRKYKEMRQAAKVLTFSILYGSTPGGVALQLGLSPERAEELINMYFTEFPLIRSFIEDAHVMAEKNHYVVTPFGQRKHEFGTLPEFQYTAAFNACKRNAQNVLIQSTTSTLGLFAFSNLNADISRLGAKCICTVYDSIEIEAPMEVAAEVIEKGFYYMNDYPQEVFDWLDFPIGADGEIGFNWGELHHVHRGITQKEIMERLAR